MPVLDRGDTKIVWEEQGSGEPLLLIMGHGWPRQMWARHLPSLTARFRVIMFDNRGIGETTTTAKSWTLQDMAADAVAVLDAAGVERAHVYGVSMGGGIAQVVALDHPDRVGALILGCTAPQAAKSRFPFLTLAGRVLRSAFSGRRTLRLAIYSAIAYGPSTDRALIAEDAQLLASLHRPKDGIEAQRQAILGYPGSLSRLHEIQAPTLVIHGDRDRLVPIDRGRILAAHISGARFVVLAGAGHMYLTDATEEADEAVTTFLADNSRQRI